jgi:hypothetical protein
VADVQATDRSDDHIPDADVADEDAAGAHVADEYAADADVADEDAAGAHDTDEFAVNADECTAVDTDEYTDVGAADKLEGAVHVDANADQCRPTAKHP